MQCVRIFQPSGRGVTQAHTIQFRVLSNSDIKHIKDTYASNKTSLRSLRSERFVRRFGAHYSPALSIRV